MTNPTSENAARLAVNAVALKAENDRLRAALQRIHDEYKRNPWHPDSTYPTEYSKAWHDGFVTTLASHSLVAFEALDPAGWAEHEKDMQAASGSDKDWYRRTGNCGKCAVVASSCECDGACDCWALHGPPLEPWKSSGDYKRERDELAAQIESARNLCARGCLGTLPMEVTS